MESHLKNAAAPAPSSLAGGEVRDMSGETVMGMRVAAYRHPASCPPGLDRAEWLAFFNGSPPNTYCEHWSTPGEHRTDVERLFTEADVHRILAALSPEAPAREGGELDPKTVALKWEKVETTALEEWRAEFGDYIALATLGHDNDWTHRVNNSGRIGYKSADEAKAAALADLQGRLLIRLHAARKTVALYDALTPRHEAPASEGDAS